MQKISGYSVIEVLLAGSILALAVSGIVIAIIFAQRSNQATLAQEQAMNMANDGIEILRSIRNRDYSLLVNGTNMALGFTNNQWEIITNPLPTDDNINNRTRRITIIDGATPDEKQITVTVVYTINPEGDTKSIERTEIIANTFAKNPSGVTATSNNYQLLDDVVGEYQNTFISP